MPLWLMQHHQRGQERYAKGQDYEGNLVFFFEKNTRGDKQKTYTTGTFNSAKRRLTSRTLTCFN